ncbi:MAG TPA: hypothetical protein VLE20_10305, partial [Blastocatellia bacterium]|nr:hypothetical protein [Blastocatellia bacterium]
LIVRDTPANLEMVEQMINSLDKSKAEVLIDIQIYEVSRTDLLQIGNQFTTTASTTSTGALVPGLNQLGGYGSASYQPGAIQAAAVAAGKIFAIGLPTSAVSFFQDKGKAKLLASTQVHVIDGEAHAIRIGQRVPIRTATLPTLGTTPTTPGQPNPPGTAVTGFGVEQIQYESVGLNIDMTPSVFEDDVQMKMKIETSSIDGSTSSLTPTFNQRTMSSIARVKDGQTSMIAGVSQNVEAKSVRGMPFIGGIPILGRLFSTPETKETQSDVVITVTPHILRRADIVEDDHLAKWAGDAQNSSNQLKIDQILYLADLEDSQANPVAAAGAEPANPVVEPKPPTPSSSIVPTRSEPPGVVVQRLPTGQPPPATRPNIIKSTVDRPGGQSLVENNKPAKLDDEDEDDEDEDDDEDVSPNQAAGPLTVYVRPTTSVATKGQDLYVAIFVNGNGEMSSAHISLNYDPNLLEVKGVRDSGMLSAGARADLQFAADGGAVNIQMDRPQGVGAVPARGQLCLIVFAVKAPGQSPLLLNEQSTFFRTPTGQNLPIKVQSSQVEIR